jgi:hypothetical protein
MMAPRRLLRALALCAGLSTAGPLPVRAAEVVELATSQRFTTPLVIAGKNYSLVGVGVRMQGAAKPPQRLYAMAMYVDHAGAKVQFPSLLHKAPTHAMMMAESRAQNFVIWGRYAKLAVLRLLRPMTKAELVAMFREGLADSLSDKAPAELRSSTEALLKLFDQDLKEGQELRIHTDDNWHIEVYLDGVKKAGPQDPKLCRHLWEMWLGSHAQKDMRSTLVDRLEVLKK